MDMKSYMELHECLDKVSDRLGVLHNMICTLHTGMMGERMSRQALDCVEGVDFCINDIKSLADKCLEHIPKDCNIINENEKA